MNPVLRKVFFVITSTGLLSSMSKSLLCIYYYVTIPQTDRNSNGRQCGKAAR